MSDTNSTENYSAAGEVGQIRVKRTAFQRAWIELKKAPITAWFGMIVIAIYVIVVLLAPWVAPYGEAQVFPGAYAPWSEEHILGTDQIGRDLFSRLIYGGRNTVGIAFVTTVLAFVIGGAFGLWAAIDRKWVDQGLSRMVDVLMAIPSLIFALVILAILNKTTFNLIIVIAVLDSTRVFRLTRAVALNVVVMDYVEAARLRGEGLGWVMRKEILPTLFHRLLQNSACASASYS